MSSSSTAGSEDLRPSRKEQQQREPPCRKQAILKSRGVSSRVLSQLQLEKLKTHKYSSSSSSLLDPYLEPFWSWGTNQLPLWLAPNLLTFTGLGINVLTALMLLLQSPDLKQPIPGWMCLLSGLGLFIYMNLDAMDGKQARRTGSSSPLGELFDHGCDSFSTVFLALGVAASTQMGRFPVLTLVHCLLGSLVFACTHWRTYVSGSLSFGLVDVTEAELLMVSIHLGSGILGSGFWTDPPVLFSWTWMHLICFSGFCFELYSIWKTLRIVLENCSVSGKKGSARKGGMISVSPGIPISLAFGSMIWIAVKEAELYLEHPVLFILTMGLIASKVTDRLIMAHMTKSRMELFDWVLLGPGAIILNHSIGLGFSSVGLLWASFVFTVLDSCVYCCRVCTEITQFLSIKLFTIDYEK